MCRTPIFTALTLYGDAVQSSNGLYCVFISSVAPPGNFALSPTTITRSGAATHWCGPPSPPTTDASAGLASPVLSLPSGVLANGSLLLLHAPRRINTKTDRRMSVPPAHGKGDHADPGSSYA